jgi:hypothetical protein
VGQRLLGGSRAALKPIAIFRDRALQMDLTSN